MPARLVAGALAAETLLVTLVSLTRQPALSLPIELTAQGLPIGLQIVGRHFDEASVLRLAAVCERLVSFEAPWAQSPEQLPR